MNIAVRVDATPDIGSGHVMRCLCLADLLRNEGAAVRFVCRFLPDSLLPTTEDGDTFGYTAQIMARAQVIPQGYIDAADLIVGLPEWETWSELLDLTVTQAMPEA